jgi:hypothetical protein
MTKVVLQIGMRNFLPILLHKKETFPIIKLTVTFRFDTFDACSKLALAVQEDLKRLGYTGGF